MKAENDQQAIEGLREDIDRIDREIIALLTRRQGVAKSIGALKRRLGLEIIDPAREQVVLKELSARAGEGLDPLAVRSIFSEIISAARSVQQVPTVAYLGPEGTFSHRAALALFGHAASFRAADQIEDVFQMVENGACRHGVVPIENSFQGSVHNTLDMLYRFELRISAEMSLRIRNHLLSKAKDIQDIKRLYSHPMPVAQSYTWIKSHLPGIPIKEVASTTLAAKMAVEDPEGASVGGRLAATTYGLNILEADIEDNPGNLTRFVAIGKERAKPTGKDKTSVLFSLKHRPGELHGALSILAGKGLNLTRIESRPMRTRNWEYLFFVDLEGHEQDANVNSALREMEEHCAFLKRLGSYPEGGEPWD